MADLINFFVSRFPNPSDHLRSKDQGIELIADGVEQSAEFAKLKDAATSCKIKLALNMSVEFAGANLEILTSLKPTASDVDVSEKVVVLQADKKKLALKIDAAKKEVKKISAEIKKLDPKRNAQRIKKFRSSLEKVEKTIVQYQKSIENIEASITSAGILNRLQQNLDFLREASQIFDGLCSNSARKRKGALFVTKNLDAVTKMIQDGSLMELRQLIAETLVALRVLKQSTNPGFPDLRLLIRTIHALVASVEEHEAAEKNGSSKSLSFVKACKIMDRPISFPAWSKHVDECSCDPRKKTIEGRLLESHPLEKARAVTEYKKALKRRRDCTDQGEDGDCSCECECDDSCQPQNPCCIELNSYVSDLMTVRETLECYEPGDLAHIQNVMSGETIVRTHESVKETEDYSETETTTSRSEERDHQSSERFGLQEAMQKTVSQDFAADAGVTTSGKYGAPGNKVAVSAHANVSYARSSSEAKQTARNFAKDVTQRSIIKVQEESRKLSTHRVLRRITENNVHSFTAEEQGHIIGQYFWVNKRSVAQVMNWGKRLMYDFTVPEPAKQYKHLISLKTDTKVKSLDKPEKPDLAPSDITYDNYVQLAAEYGVDIVSPPAREISFVKTYDKPAHEGLQEWTVDNFTIETNSPNDYDYVPYKARVSSLFSGGGSRYHHICVGNVNFTIHTSVTAVEKDLAYSGPTSMVPVITKSRGDDFTVYIEVYCALSEDAHKKWRMESFQKIIEKYENEMLEYKSAVASARENVISNNRIKGRNPFLNRETEKTELWRLVVSMISCQHFDRFGAMKNRVEPCGYPQLDFQQAQDEGAFIQFFEQVFEVEQMMYLFYPYFWGKKCSWAENIETDSGDALFDKFLASGAARVTLPVRSGMEALALHYEQTGEIWFGNAQPDYDPDSPHFLAMHEEFKSRSGNFQEDRPGLVDVDFDLYDANGNAVGAGANQIIIKGTDYWWNWTEIPDQDYPNDAGALDDEEIENDIDREIIIGRSSYRIVDIEIYRGRDLGESQVYTPSGAAQESDRDFIQKMKWIVTLDRPVSLPVKTPPYPDKNLKYATGAIYVGAEWENVVPTNLVWLRPQNDDGTYENCLPCYPVECE